jgi:repressor of nif and glnA expression
MPITEKDVVDIMRTEKRPLKARQIAFILRTERGMEIARSDVNRLLYQMETRGLVSSDEQYFWQLTGEAKYGPPQD